MSDDKKNPIERSGGFYYLPMWGIWLGMEISMRKKGYDQNCNPLILFLVVPTGFEPVFTGVRGR